MPTSRIELASIALQANALPIKLQRHKSKQNRTTITCVEDTGFTIKLYSLGPFYKIPHCINYYINSIC